jgi:hypothetical protein
MFKKTHLTLAALLILSTGLTACARPQQSSTTPPEPMNMRMAKETAAINAQSQKASYEWVIHTPSASIQAGQPVSLNFQVNNMLTKQPITALNEVHTKLVHLIIVSKDLKTFSHIHPEVLSNGNMKVQAIFPREGRYVSYIQFFPVDSEEQTLSQTLQVGQKQPEVAKLVSDVDQPKMVDGYTFRLRGYPTEANKPSMATLVIEKAGKPVKHIEPYLGAGGHSVLLSQDAMTFLHVHPMTEPVGPYYQSPLQFHTEVPQAGLYKMWTQIQIDGKVKTVDFTFKVI